MARIYLEFKDAKSQKFWEGEVKGATLTTRWGRVGTDGQSKAFELSSKSEAEAELKSKASSKTRKGYAETAGGGATKATPKASPSPAPKAKAAPPKPPPTPTKASAPMKATDLKGDLIRLPDHPSVLSFSSDGASLAAHGISKLHLVDVATRAWSNTLDSREAKAVLFHDGHLFVGTKTISLVDVGSGKKLLALKDHKAPANAFAGSGDTLFTGGGDYMNTHDRFLRAFDASTGALKWKAKPGKNAGALSLAVVDDLVCVAAEDGCVRAFAHDGTPRGEVRLGPAAEYSSPFGGVARAGRGLVASTAVEQECFATWVTLGPELSVDAVVPIPLKDVDRSEGVLVGTPMMAGGRVVVPVYYCVKGSSRVVVAVFDEASRTLSSVCTPVGMNSPGDCALSPDGTFAWAVADGIAVTKLFDASPGGKAKPVGGKAEAPSGNAKSPAPKAAAASNKSAALGELAGAMTGGGPSRACCFEGSFDKAPKIAWARAEYASSADEFGGSVVADEDIVVGSSSGHVTALDVRSGKTLWSTKTADSQSWATSGISIANGSVFMATNHGLYAFDGKSGEVTWRARIAGAAGAPLVFDDVCVIGGNKGLYAQSLAKKGRKAWSFPLKNGIRTAPAYRDGLIYFCADTMLVALDVGQQKIAWSVPASEPLRTGPVLAGELVVYLAKPGLLTAANRKTGKEAWRAKVVLAAGQRPFAASGDAVIIKDDRGVMHALDVSSGKARWSSKCGRKKPYGIGCSGPIVVGDSVVCVTVEDTTSSPRYLTGLHLKTGKVRWDMDHTPIKRAIAKEQKKSGSDFDGEPSWYCTPHVAGGVLYAQADSGIVALR